MRKYVAAVLAATALALTGCGADAAPSAEKCGGEQAGITYRDGVLTYASDQDETGDAYACLLDELLDDKNGITVATGIDNGDRMETREMNGYAVSWSSTERGIELMFSPAR